MPRLAIIIVNYNTKELLLQCLESLSGESDLEIVVVDNASTDGSDDAVRSGFPLVRVVASEENLGFARANNLGSKYCTSANILFLNPDTVVEEGAIKSILEYMTTYPEAGIVGPQLLDERRVPQASIGSDPTVLGFIFDKPMAVIDRLFGGSTAVGSLLGRLSAKYRIPAEPAEVDWVSGAALCCRREIWEQLGGFDELFFMYYEDNDLCFRARKLGWRICYLPSARIVHLVGRSQSKGSATKTQTYFASQSYFFRKHYGTGIASLMEILRWPYRVLNLRTRVNRHY